MFGVVYGSGALHHPSSSSDYMVGPKIAPYDGGSTLSKAQQDKLYEWGLPITEIDLDELTPEQQYVFNQLANELGIEEDTLVEAAKNASVASIIGTVGNPDIPRMVALAPGFKAPATFFSSGGSHGGSEVPLYCKGPGDACHPMQLHKGTISQGFIAQFMRCAGRLDRYSTTKDDITKAIQNTMYLMEKAAGVTYVTDLFDGETAVDKPYYKTNVMEHMLEGVNDNFLAIVESEMIDEAPPLFDLLASMYEYSSSDYEYPPASPGNKFFAV
jgi:hypothetical protein